MWKIVSLAALVVMSVGVNSQQLRHPSPTISASPLTPVEGQPLSLTCVPPIGVDAAQYRWLKDFGNVSGGIDGVLTFDSLVAKDSGSFRCQYLDSSDKQSELSSTFDLSVGKPDKPSLRSEPRGPLIGTNSYFRLYCERTRDSADSYTLYKDGISFETQTYETFQFEPTKEMSGTYTCTVTDGSMQSDLSNALNLTFIEPLRIDYSEEFPAIGSALTLTCITHLNLPGMQFQWTLFYRHVHTASVPSYTIPKLTKNNEGEYRCVVVLMLDGNRQRSQDSEPFFLAFTPPGRPSIVSSRDTNWMSMGILTCQANRTSSVGHQWAYLYFNGEKIAQKNGTQGYTEFRQQVLFRDVGKYTCTYSNKLGESEQSAVGNLNVAAWTPAKRWVEKQVMLKGMPLKCQKPRNNREVVRYCSIYIDGRRYQEIGGCSKPFIIQHSMSGEYTCTATNYNSTSPTGTPGKVTFIDQPMIKYATQDPPVLNQPYSLKCVTDISDATFSWYKGHFEFVKISGGNSRLLTFASLSTSDMGTYRCGIHVEGKRFMSDPFRFNSESLNLDPDVRVVSHYFSNRYRLEANSTMLSCASADAVGYTLFRDGQRVSMQPSGHFSVFNGVESDNYSCMLITKFGETVSGKAAHLQGTREVTITASTPVAMIGQDLTLTCTTPHSDPDIQYSWKIYNRTVDSNRDSSVPRKKGKTLTFTPVTKADAGLYLCEIERNGTIILSFDYYMMALERPIPPSIRDNLNTLESLRPELARRKRQVMSGLSSQSFQLRCACRDFRCNQQNPVRLYKDDVAVDNPKILEEHPGQSRTYLIDMGNPANAGRYSCTAINVFGESEHSFSVRADLSLFWPSAVLTVDNPDAREGQDITFTCDVPSKILGYQVKWFRNGFELFHTGRLMQLRSLVREHDGFYFCTYSTDPDEFFHRYYGRSSNIIFLVFQKPLQPTLYLDIDDIEPVIKPEYVDIRDERYSGNGDDRRKRYVHYTFGVNGDIPLRCHSQVPFAAHAWTMINASHDTYTLYKDGQQVEANNPTGHFVVTGLSAGQYKYTCKTTNRAGDSLSSYELLVNVAERPTIDVSPTSPTLTQSLTLTCNTAPTTESFEIFWMKNGKIMSEKSDNLTLEDLNAYDEGSYTCRQKIESTYQPRSEEYILVFGSKAATPEITTFMPITMEKGISLDLFCQSPSTTSSVAKFYRNGIAVATVMDKVLDDAGQVRFVFTISSTEASDSGAYTCTVENSQGTSDLSQSLTITVRGDSGCFPGFYRTDSGKCVVCPHGTYQPDAGQSSCLKCPDGKFTQAEAATDVSQCIVIPAARKMYLRVTVDMPFDTAQANSVSLAVRDILDQNLTSRAGPSGIMAPNIVNAASGSTGTVMLVPLIFASNVTKAIYTHLGLQIYNKFYSTQSQIKVAGSSYTIQTVDMFLNEADAQANANTLDINECTINPKLCPVVETCTNDAGGIGSFTCNCLPGFTRQTKDADCKDLDECSTSGLCTGPNEQCINTIGSYTCDCADGFTRRTPEDDCSNFNRTQLDLYPYGLDIGDRHLPKGDDKVSAPIAFGNGLPFGTRKYLNVHVCTNAMITVGKPMMFWYWGDLAYRYSRGHRIIAPLMSDIDTNFSGEVLYQMYEKGTETHSFTSDRTKDVLERASSDVLDNFGIDGYDPTHVLVATWDAVWSRLHMRDARGGAVARKRRQIEPRYLATFQVVIITDGMTTYVIFMYKRGEFNWLYVPGGSVSVGYVNDMEYVNFVPPGSYLTERLDRLIGNKGRFGTWMALVGSVYNLNQLCENFYFNNLNLLTDLTFKEKIAALLDCPCTLTQMGRQWSLVLHEGNRVCFALNNLITRFFDHTHNKLCCYRLHHGLPWWTQRESMTFISSPPDAGYVTLYDPFVRSLTVQDSYLNDLNPHRWCCLQANSSRLCDLFYIIRALHQCSPIAIIISGGALGDPHFTSLDGKKYTFNGLGEYVMSHIPSKNFVMQVRTAKATLSDGTETKATVFSAVAAKEGDYAMLQVQLSASKDRLIIYGNGQDYTMAFYNDTRFSTTIGNDLLLERSDDNDEVPRVVAYFPSGVEISVSLGVRSLGVGVTMLSTLKGLTAGLLGNFNGDPSDDFQLPNGTKLDDSLSERQIFEQFGKFWAVTQQDSVFTYPLGESAADYSHPEFIPLFREEIDQSDLQAAEAVCGKDNDACLFDYVATKSKQFAENTKKTDEKGDKTRTELVNVSPSISLGSESRNISISTGETVNIPVLASDPDGDPLTFELVGSPVGVQVSESGVVTYQADGNMPVTISIVAVDNKGGRSPALTTPVTICTSCSGHGQCDQSQVRAEIYEGGNFLKYICQCHKAYSGPECEEDRDACADNPCSEGQTCTDTPAEQEDLTGAPAYACGPCPQGFFNLQNKCTDIDECTRGHPCSHECTNTFGSFICTCPAGFRSNPSDEFSCLDINECAEKTHKCEHKCVNTQGSYKCECEQEYTLQSDQHTCQLVSTSVCANSQCEQICLVGDNNTPKCSCRSFYQIDPDNPAKCVDVDECSLANKPCAQQCTNKIGGYECSCYPGFKLEDDKTSCEPCRSPNYGMNCEKICLCNGRSVGCDPVRGCVCQTGWTGPTCQGNVNACDSSDVCGANEVCTDVGGMRKCQCGDGYQQVNGSCVDVDDCADEMTHNCYSIKHEVCSNVEGSYICNCQPGFKKNSAGQCEDINECSTGLHNCQQQCINTIGSFSCQCHFGYRLDDTDRTKCVFNKDVCRDEGNLRCAHGCTVDLSTKVASCICNSGYKLAADRQGCIDINECSDVTLNKCSKQDLCTNTFGGYLCSCGHGMQLDNDQRSCKVCEGQTWGFNCMNDCKCSPAGAKHCDPIKGCICKPTYTGRYCEIKAECQDSTSCPDIQVCTITLAGYRCECPAGYRKADDQCVDVNECLDSNLNTCDQECTNYAGGFTCTCFTGFTYNMAAKSCYDVNECEQGTHGCSQLCDNTQGGYRCHCRVGFELGVDGVTCTAISACSAKKCAHDCALVNGQETCFCPRGQQVSSSNELLCEDVDLCAGRPCEQTCEENTEGTDFICSCGTGYKLAGDGLSCQMCEPGSFGLECSDTCGCVQDNSEAQVCNPESGACLCKAGWEGDNCNEDIDECSRVTNPCSDPNSHCVNTPGSFMCACKDGYFMRNTSTELCEVCDSNFYGHGCSLGCECNPDRMSCNSVNGSCQCLDGWTGSNCDEDEDECEQGLNHCGSYTPFLKAFCVNLPGSYVCDCPVGYTANDFTMSCDDIDECVSPDLNACVGQCMNTPGSYSCFCPSGFTKASNGRCIDIDECGTINPCTNNQRCINTYGNFTCECKPGYAENSAGDCEDIDECSVQPSPCDSGNECVNYPGNYTCGCEPGYKKDASDKCVDVNECLADVCSATTETCQNTEGNYNCNCKPGFKRNNHNNCVDVDECLSGTPPCDNGQECFNYVGSYSCDCELGFQKDSSDECVDKDECKDPGNLCTQGCVNQLGSFFCFCHDGYRQTASGQCFDIDECETNPCQDHQKCTNTEGSYSCQCAAGYVTNTDGACVAKYSLIFEMHFQLFNPTNAMLIFGNTEYKNVAEEIQKQIHNQLQDLLTGFLHFGITNLRRGSLIAEGEVAVDNDTNENPTGAALKAISELSVTGITINGINQTQVQIKVNDIDVSKAMSQCELRQKVQPCSHRETCVEDDEGVSICRSDDDDNDDDDDDNTAMWIGIIIGVAVLLIIIVAVIIFVVLRGRKKQSYTATKEERELAVLEEELAPVREVPRSEEATPSETLIQSTSQEESGDM